MKKFIVIIFLFLGATVMAQTDNGWEPWQKTSCYSKIQFRIKYVEQRGEQHIWKVQFKNDYQQLISFNYNITHNVEQYTITTHRKTLNANQLSEEIELYTKEDDIFLLVDKVSLTPYPEDFIDCE